MKLAPMTRFGTLLLGLGAMGFFWAEPPMDLVRSGRFQLVAASNPDALSYMQMIQSVYYAGVLGMVFGILLIALGVMQSRPGAGSSTR